MLNVFSRHTQQPSDDAIQILQSSLDKANKGERVSSSNLNKLLKSLNNSSKEISYPQFKEAKGIINNLKGILRKQNSNQFGKKIDKIYDASQKTLGKLSDAGKAERADAYKESIGVGVKEAVKLIKEGIPFLIKKRAKAESRLNKNIDRLPAGKIKDEAIKIANKRQWDLFGRTTAITYNLFPYTTEKVDTGKGYSRMQEKVPPEQNTWVGLEQLGESLEKAERVLSQAQSYISHEDNFKFNAPEDTGNIKLTKHQKALQWFTSKLSLDIENDERRKESIEKHNAGK